MTTVTHHVKFSVVSKNVHVATPAVTLPPGDYEGYIDYEQEADTDPRMVLAMIFLDEERTANLGLTGAPRPVKFEVLRYVYSGDVRIVED